MFAPFTKPGKRVIFPFLISVLFFFLLMLCVPLVSDDLEFSQLHFSGFADLMDYILHYGNGRVLGNLCAITLVKFPVFVAFLKALIIAGIIFIIPALFGVTSLSGYLLSFFLFASIPQTLFAQVYSWASGFFNYLPPIWITLVILRLFQRYDGTEKSGEKATLLASIFVLGLAGQLFVEHNSLINVLLAGILSFNRYRRKLPVLPALAWAAAAILGCLIMFAVPVVFSVPGNRSEGYRSVGIGNLSSWIASCASKVVSFGSNFPPFGVLAVVGATALTTHLTSAHRKERWNRLIYSWLVIVAGYFVLTDILLEGSWFPTYYGIQLLVTTMLSLSAFFLWILVLIPVENKSVKWGIYVLLGLAFLSLAPFAVVSPAPVRVLFLPYTCIVAALFLFYPFAAQKLGAPFQLWLRRVIRPLTALTVLLLTVCFGNIFWLNNLRTTHIRSEMEQGKASISVFAIPYDYVHWDGLWSYGYGYYYEEPFDIAFSLEDFSTWYEANGN